MALNAHKETEKRMSEAREAELAALIMQDIQLRREKAEENGVLAYARKPIPRGRPNERFLQNTLKNLGSANRRREENQMWEQYKAKTDPMSSNLRSSHQQDRHGDKVKPRGRGTINFQPSSPSESDASECSRGRKRSRASYESSSSDASSAGKNTQHNTQPHFARQHSSQTEASSDSEEDEAPKSSIQRPMRGRGTTGSKAEDTIGPFLVPQTEEERVEYDDERYKKRKKLGPDKPAWTRTEPSLSAILRQSGKLAISPNGRDASNPVKKRKKEKKDYKKKRKSKKEKKKRKAGV